jgi:hypothetical protein
MRSVKMWQTAQYPQASIQSTVLLEEQKVAKLAKKFPAFYVIWMFFAVFKRDRHWNQSWDIRIQSTPHKLFL